MRRRALLLLIAVVADVVVDASVVVRDTAFYDTLDVAPDASSQEIRQAYRKLSMRWHPDKNPDQEAEAQARFVEISEAYQTLYDAERRSTYDRQGKPRTAGGGAGFQSFHQMFEDMLRSQGTGAGPVDLFGNSKAVERVGKGVGAWCRHARSALQQRRGGGSRVWRGGDGVMIYCVCHA
jgi:DnaJ-class molecular chaperone